MMAIRRVSAIYRRMLRNLPLIALVAASAISLAHAQGTQMKEPDDVKPVSISGCLSARAKNGAYILSSIFARPITVVGPSYLQMGMGHQVTLKGTWQSSGASAEAKNASLPRLFVATEVKVESRQCASPPSDPKSTATKPSNSSGGN